MSDIDPAELAIALKVLQAAERLVEDDPDLGWWDHEAAVTDEAYQQMEPRALGDAIVASADALGGRVRGLKWVYEPPVLRFFTGRFGQV